MNNIFGEINNVKKYFENKNWIYEINDNGVRFYKNGTGLNDSKQIVDFSTKKANVLFMNRLIVLNLLQLITFHKC